MDMTIKSIVSMVN